MYVNIIFEKFALILLRINFVYFDHEHSCFQHFNLIYHKGEVLFEKCICTCVPLHVSTMYNNNNDDDDNNYNNNNNDNDSNNI